MIHQGFTALRRLNIDNIIMDCLHRNAWLLLVVGILGSVFFINQAQAELVMGEAPNFTLKSLRGDNIKLSEHRGEVIIVNFWATYCDKCKDIFPVLNDLYLKYRDQGFTTLSISTDTDINKISKYLRNMQVAFPVLMDVTHEVSEKYEVAGLPSVYILDRDGRLRYVYKEYKQGNEDEYRKYVRELMEE